MAKVKITKAQDEPGWNLAVETRQGWKLFSYLTTWNRVLLALNNPHSWEYDVCRAAYDFWQEEYPAPSTN